MIRKTFCSICLLAIFTCSQLSGDIFFEHLESEGGIELTNGFCRDRAGYLWIGTYFQGLARFDGYSTKWYRVEKEKSDSESISSNAVMAIAEDRAERLWVATWDGLDRLDAQRDKFIHYRNEPGNPRSLADNQVSWVMEDHSGTIWVLTSSAVHRYVPDADDFIRYHSLGDLAEPPFYSHMVEDSNGMMWVLSTKGGLHQLDPDSGDFNFYRSEKIDNNEFGRKRLEMDPNGRHIWMAINRSGLLRFDIDQKTFYRYPTDSSYSGIGLPNDAARDVIHLDENTLAVAVDQGGICVLDKRTDRFTYINETTDGVGGLTTDGISSLYKDDEGILWVGTTRGGIFYNNASHFKFDTYTSSGRSEVSLSGGIVGAIFEDSQGLVWIGTDGSGVNILNREKGEISVISTANSNLTSDVIRSFVEDDEGNIWIATWNGGLNRYIRETGMVEPTESPDLVKELIGERGIWSLQMDHAQRFWLCTNRYVMLLDKQLKLQAKTAGQSATGSRIGHIYQFEDDVIYYANNEGAYVFDEQTQEMIPFVEGLQVVHMAKDKEGRCYFATSDLGVFVYSAEGVLLMTLTEENGLADDSTRSLQLAGNDALWVGTIHGLSRVDLEDYSISNFFEEDGLQGDSYFLQSATTLRDGTLAFGGVNGVSFWNPESAVSKVFDAPVYIDGMKVFNQTVDMGSLLVEENEAQGASRKIAVDWSSKMVSFEFSAVGFTYPDKNRYAYMLKGFDKHWIFTDSKNRKATYTNLSPGDYELVVKAADANGNWSQNEARLDLRIIPPFWRTLWFYTLAVIAVLLLGYLYLHYRELNLRREKVRLKREVKERSLLINEITKAKNEAEESDRLKSQFLANMSHEIRTPMNAIVGFSELMLEPNTSPEEKKSFVKHITVGAESLLRLVEDILDFSMIEANQLKIKVKDFMLIDLLNELHQRFLIYPQLGEVEFVYQNPFKNSTIVVRSDYFRMRQVISNLLSNAFKFTHSGSVELGLREAKDGLSIYVKDTGEGMDAEELESIFSEFVKLERHDEQAVRGVGLGLSISERLSGLLGCQLKVASVKGEGTEFQLLIPRVMIAGEVAGEVEVAENKPVQTYNWEGRSILIVEDEQSNFEYLQEALRGTNIQIDCVKNGSEAVKRIEDASNSYDLVLMDISMPVMDGVASLKEIRRIKPELKVIAQTAHAMAEDRAKYKEAGFDDYLSKPILRDRLYASIAQFI